MSDVLAPPSPYAGRALTRRDHLTLSAFWFATNFHWGALLVPMLPGEVATLAPRVKGEALGYLIGATALIALLVPLFVGAISDRCLSRWGRRRPFIAAGTLVNVIGLAMMALATQIGRPVEIGTSVLAALSASPGLQLLFGGFVVVQFGSNIASAAYMGVIPDLVPEDQRGGASGYMALMSQFGTLLGAIGCGLLLQHASETAKYLLIAAVLVLVALWTCLGIRENPLTIRPARLAWGPYLRSLWINPKEHPDFAWVWITRALVMLGFYAIQPNVNYYLVDVIGVPQDKVGATAPLLLGVILIFASLSGYFGGVISDRVGRKRVVFVANGVIAVVSMAFILCRSVPQALLVGTVFGLGYGAYISVDYALGTDVLPSKSEAGKEMAVWHVAMTLPQSIGAPIAGQLLSAFGRRESRVNGELIVNYPLPGYIAIFALCSLAFALGAVLLKNVKGVR